MATTASTACIASVTLEVADREAVRGFYTAFGVDRYIRLRASEAHSIAGTTGAFTDPDGFAREAATSPASADPTAPVPA